MTAIHSASPQELSLLRSSGRMSRFALALLDSNVVWKARINQTKFTLSYMSSLTWADQSFGNYEDVVPGMTLWVGSAEGLSDLGKLRVRKPLTSTQIFFDPVAHIRFENELYLTVVDDFPIKGIPFAYDAENIPYANTDEIYVDQNTRCKPIVIMGGETVVELVNGEGFLERDASDSWGPGSTSFEFLWECNTAENIEDHTTPTPRFKFTTTGTHLLSCQITSNNGLVTKRYQKVYVFDSLTYDIKLETPPYAFIGNGGYEASIRVFAGQDTSRLKEGTRVILFTHKEYFGEDEISLGQCLGSEKVVLNGYIAAGTVKTDQATGDTVFTLRGLQGKLKEAQSQAVQMFRTLSESKAWNEIKNPTADLLYWHFISVRSTLSQVMDCYPPKLPLIYPNLDAFRGSLFDQLTTLADRVLGRIGCDAYGRLFFELRPEILSDEDKEALITICAIQREHRSGVSLDSTTDGLLSAIYSSSICISGSEVEPRTFYSVSPGSIELESGLPQTIDYLSASQEHSNSLAGRLLSDANNKEILTIQLPENNRLITMYPAQSLQIFVEEDETPLNTSRSGKMIPEYIRMIYDEISGAISYEISGRILQPEAPSAKGVIPIADGAGNLDLDSSIELPNFSSGFSGLPGDFNLPLLPGLPQLPGFPNDTKTVPLTTAWVSDVLENLLWYTKDMEKLDQEWFQVSGLPSEIQFSKFLITPDGHLYVHYNQAIYWATCENPSFKILVDLDWLRTEYPGGLVEDQQVVSSIGVSSVEPNQLICIMGSSYLGTQSGNVWIGNENGLSKGASVPTGAYPAFGSSGDITWGNGYWICTYGIQFSPFPATLKISSNGGTILDSIGAFNFNEMAIRHARGSMTTRIIGWQQAAINELRYSDDDGFTWNDLTSLGANNGFFEKHSVAISPSGEKMMICTGFSFVRQLHYSIDGGNTFTEIDTLPPLFIPVSVSCIDEDRWIVAGYEDTLPEYIPLIYFSDDFGDTWFPKYGNLPIVKTTPGTGLFQIRAK